MSSICVLRNQG
uniref:Uncharacterized protein n=1 Tax=Anguilla anguilla TaxID=7936 RepID=A0A0E9TTJ2_ANGAN